MIYVILINLRDNNANTLLYHGCLLHNFSFQMPNLDILVKVDIHG